MFSALTLNPMGKGRCLEIEDCGGGYAAKAKCQLNQPTPSLSKRSFGVGSIHCGPTVFPRKQCERSPINGINHFLHIQMP